MHLWGHINELNKSIIYAPHKGLLYSEANIFDNITNIGFRYIKQLRRDMLDYVFMIEVMNQRPLAVKGGFYPLLDPTLHEYQDTSYNPLYDLSEYGEKTLEEDCRLDGDLSPLFPLRIAVDWGDRISCMSIAQWLPGEYRFLKDMYVKHPKLVNDLADAFNDYYKHHPIKKLLFIRDNEYGNRRGPNSNVTYNQAFTQRLNEHGWRVTAVDLGRIPDHQHRYLLWQELMKEKDQSRPRIRFNRTGCKHMLISMKQAPAKQGKRGIEKDKGSEKSGDQLRATHLSDTADLHAISIERGASGRGGFIDNIGV